MNTARILVVDDDRAFRLSTAALLRAEGHAVQVAEDGSAAVAALRTAHESAAPMDLVLLDVRMPGLDGLGVVEALRVWGERVPIMMISGVGTVESAVRALHLGADDFLTKPVEPDVLVARVAELLERRPESALHGTANPGGIVGRAPSMAPFFASLRRVAPTDTTVLIQGETGTGKERAARAVHDLSTRNGEPFLAVNCAALSEGVLESELFGHVKGAFTGALRDREGLFEAAGQGTLFLDEIGEISAAMQQRLLRVLQEREVTRVGTSKPVKVQARVVAATHADLKTLVARGRFREDLLYRLAVFPLTLPPLRERRGDIPLLTLHALRELRARGVARDGLSCSPFAMRLLRQFAWPGNVRQLFAVIEAAAIHADFGRIEAQHLPPEVRVGGGDEAATGAGSARYRGRSEGDERTAIVAALAETHGVLARAAELLGMGRTTLWRKLRAYGLEATVGEGGAQPEGATALAE
ncbi:sigma-54-dependent transcriptional regulator [Gemmatimonas groenlandica]|uniref:Sigma-54-dependent Fis family transcriptional regulator n=1 Tax=Gemmatimonas groenlandica TaxID=2732249 RepID=A0A6M4ITU8_9BACT|nr:sigma-54 dependent transcriptional regulator [Gemmatimonas groenlandica]QJR36896.1 sigma-54-dependent Fis family transcriptional regulator [Gemmatimonas groenlandica]